MYYVEPHSVNNILSPSPLRWLLPEATPGKRAREPEAAPAGAALHLLTTCVGSHVGHFLKGVQEGSCCYYCRPKTQTDDTGMKNVITAQGRKPPRGGLPVTLRTIQPAGQGPPSAWWSHLFLRGHSSSSSCYFQLRPNNAQLLQCQSINAGHSSHPVPPGPIQLLPGNISQRRERQVFLPKRET